MFKKVKVTHELCRIQSWSSKATATKKEWQRHKLENPIIGYVVQNVVLKNGFVDYCYGHPVFTHTSAVLASKLAFNINRKPIFVARDDWEVLSE